MKKMYFSAIMSLFFYFNLSAHICSCGSVDGFILVTYYEWYAESEEACCGPWTGLGTTTDYIITTKVGEGFASSEEISEACC